LAFEIFNDAPVARGRRAHFEAAGTPAARKSFDLFQQASAKNVFPVRSLIRW